MATSPEEYSAFQSLILNSSEYYRQVQKNTGDVSPIGDCLIRLEGQEVTDFSSQYGSECSISYVAHNLAGKASVFPSYGDYTQACVFRTYGPWWQLAPSGRKRYQRTPSDFTSEDFIEVSFSECLFPVRIEVYETFNPGAIVRILACDRDGGSDIDRGKITWVTLWSGKPRPCRQRPRIFAPHLKKTDFATNLIRLELCHRYLDYYTELDGIKLVGTKTPPCDEVCIHQPVILDCSDEADGTLPAELQREIPENDNRNGQSVDSLVDHIGDLSVVTDDSSFITHLPKEIIQLILSYLDLRDLCHLSQTCSLLREHCYDPLLYIDLNLQPFWMQVSNDSLISLIPRCKHTQRLNLSWLGKGSHLCHSHIKRLLESCTEDLCTLELASCNFVDSNLLKIVIETSSNLVELNLSSCTKIEDFSIFSVVPLRKLKYLNVYRTKMDTTSIIAVLRLSPDLEHLNIASCLHMNSHINLILMEIGTHSKKLKSLDLWRMKTVNSEGLSHIYNNCPYLEELDVGWCIELKSENQCFINLARKCRRLKKLFLTANRTIRDADLIALANNCPLLEQLDILGTREVTKQAIICVLETCKNLILLDVSFCLGISASDACSWRATYPRRAIKISFQNISSS
ncbi:unnamed protein product [Candidula unifasciata]|uniref:F-box domain-containing protein n=1 Tax=Candidula unifasciata TaxID=100452 RepID=A0A8S3Z495_9EUPU|nr:unnamed protein product [Candidula unifasciata]